MCAEIISFNGELSPPIYGLPATMQRIIREVSEKRQAAIDFALGPALGGRKYSHRKPDYAQCIRL